MSDMAKDVQEVQEDEDVIDLWKRGEKLRERGGDLKEICGLFGRALKIKMFSELLASIGALHEDSNDLMTGVMMYDLSFSSDFIYSDYQQCTNRQNDMSVRVHHCMRSVCGWDNYDDRNNRLNAIIDVQIKDNVYCSLQPYHSLFYPMPDSRRLYIAKMYADWLAKVAASLRPRLSTWHSSSKMRIGFMSANFGDHPTTHLVYSMLEHHKARNRIDVFCFALSPDDNSGFRSRLVDKGNLIDLSEDTDAQATQTIRNFEIDILVDLDGHTRNSRGVILAMRPAPLQIMWLGYPATTGASYIDYVVSDDTATPTTMSGAFTEKLAYMPISCCIASHNDMFPHILNRRDVYEPRRNVVILNANDPNAIVSGVEVTNGTTLWKTDMAVARGEKAPEFVVITDRRDYQLPLDAFVYCYFGRLIKLDPGTFECWMDILKTVPGSVLWLLRFPANAQQNIIKEAIARGVNPTRIIFSDLVSKEEHVRRCQLADVGLDTMLCNGLATNVDVLWAGTPVVTMLGDTMASRMGASLLYAMRCREDLVATTRDQYVRIAVRLAMDDNFESMIRTKIKQARLTSSLFDPKQFSDYFEELCKNMLDRRRSKKPPINLWVDSKLPK